ncbi:TPA: hypothetical protein HA243_06360 [Candidatus Micrarchaeota archaeon]|nr:hypothetical protein [Candidatus Micrarchaeota archaeon]
MPPFRFPAPPNTAHCTGQLSLEALLLFLVFLSLLGIAFLSASRIGSAAQEKISFELAKSSFGDFSSKLFSACSMGNGNARTVEIQGAPATLTAQGKTITFSSGNFSAKIGSECEAVILHEGPSDGFIIENKQGKIEIS